MYQELVKYPGGTKRESVLYIICIVVGVFLVSMLSWVLSSVGLPLVDFLAVGALAVWAFLIYSRRIVEYRYSLMDTELIVTRIVGKREKPVFTLEVTDIQRIGAVEKKSELRTERYTVRTHRLRAVQMIYFANGEDRRVILQPSDHLLDLIRTRAAFREPKTSAD